ncbi:MAG: hypothetical protein J2P13_02390 [Acidobacteria bacterium]|nr:hypothetical protein [Acidobacteriota bacterium]
MAGAERGSENTSSAGTETSSSLPIITLPTNQEQAVASGEEAIGRRRRSKGTMVATAAGMMYS